MVKYSPQLNETFSALADPTRRAILNRLAAGEATVTQLAEPFDMSLPAVSKHLRVLRKAGLLVQRKDGRLRHCRLQIEPIREAAEWIESYRRFWEQQLDALDRYLEQKRKE